MQITEKFIDHETKLSSSSEKLQGEKIIDIVENNNKQLKSLHELSETLNLENEKISCDLNELFNILKTIDILENDKKMLNNKNDSDIAIVIKSIEEFECKFNDFMNIKQLENNLSITEN